VRLGRFHCRSDTPVHGRDENPLTPAVGHVVDELGFDAGVTAGFPAEEQLFVR
jgi:hypothetical protein